MTSVQTLQVQLTAEIGKNNELKNRLLALESLSSKALLQQQDELICTLHAAIRRNADLRKALQSSQDRLLAIYESNDGSDLNWPIELEAIRTVLAANRVALSLTPVETKQ